MSKGISYADKARKGALMHVIPALDITIYTLLQCAQCNYRDPELHHIAVLKKHPSPITREIIEAVYYIPIYIY